MVGVLERLRARDGDAVVASHFLATIALEQKPTATGSLPRREVIDGQQRLTTLQIMLKAVEQAIGSLSDASEDEDKKKAIDTARRQVSAHHISYEQLAGHIEESFEIGSEAQREMFMRLIFNVLVGNTDDHARNHATFWTGDTRELTPAYDIAPQRRTSREANQAMALANGTRAEQAGFAGRQFLNEYAFDDYGPVPRLRARG